MDPKKSPNPWNWVVGIFPGMELRFSSLIPGGRWIIPANPKGFSRFSTKNIPHPPQIPEPESGRAKGVGIPTEFRIWERNSVKSGFFLEAENSPFSGSGGNFGIWKDFPGIFLEFWDGRSPKKKKSHFPPWKSRSALESRRNSGREIPEGRRNSSLTSTPAHPKIPTSNNSQNSRGSTLAWISSGAGKSTSNHLKIPKIPKIPGGNSGMGGFPPRSRLVPGAFRFSLEFPESGVPD